MTRVIVLCSLVIAAPLLVVDFLLTAYLFGGTQQKPRWQHPGPRRTNNIPQPSRN